MDTSGQKEKQEIILATLSRCGSIKQACVLADIGRTTFYRWLEKSKTFREAVEQTSKEADDTVDDEIVRRAIEGIEEPLVSMGKLVYEEEPVVGGDGKPEYDSRGHPVMQRVGKVMTRKYSDSLLLALAKSRMKKYRERTDLDLLEQINEQTGGAISLSTRDLTTEELAQLKQIGLNVKARQEKR